MAEETKVGSVVWVHLSPAAEGKLVLRLTDKVEDDDVAMTLDPVVYEIHQSHVLFSTMESTVFTAFLHGFFLAVTADGTDVRAVSIAGRPLQLEHPAEQRQRAAEGPTQEALDVLAQRYQQYHQAHQRMAEAQALIHALEHGRGGPRRIAAHHNGA
jgi:hypothetical protein